MSTETEITAEEQAAFQGGFDNGQPAPAPAASNPAPGPGEVETVVAAEPEPVDELAGLPTKVRAMLEEFDVLKKTAESVPELAQRLRSAEGRVAALQKQVPAPTPPAPPKLEAFERVRAELPEVADAMEEYFQSKQPPSAPAPQEPAPTTLLDEAVPGWQDIAASPAFDEWVSKQPTDYQRQVRNTVSEPEMLRAITRFEAHKEVEASRAATDAAAKAAAFKLSQTRQNRAQAAVVPTGAARRAPAEPSLEAAFESGFASQR